jgi:acyl dehydratase
MTGHAAGEGTNDDAQAWKRMSDHVVTSSEHMVEGMLRANRAVLAAFGGTPARTSAAGPGGNGAKERDGSPGAEEPTLPTGDRTEPFVDEMFYRETDWSFERSVDTREEIDVGDWVTFTKALTDEEVRQFARISGDTNRLHLDDDFAEGSRFGGRIVHGTFVGSLISAALARLPGLTIYLSQDLTFEGPAGIGDELTARCEVIEELGHDRYRLETVVHDDDVDEPVIDGEAVVLIDETPGEE